MPKTDTGRWTFCEHANEAPRVCPCPSDCICREQGSCRNIRVALAEVQRLVREGKVDIANDAARTCTRAVVAKAGYRKGVIIFQWSRPGIGFGELTFAVRNGKLFVDTECCSTAFCLDILRQAIDEAVDRN